MINRSLVILREKQRFVDWLQSLPDPANTTLDELNSDNAAYLKIYNSAAPTVGSDSPDLVFPVPISQRRSLVIPEGYDFSSLSFACVITGGTAGSTSPTNPVPVRLVTS